MKIKRLKIFGQCRCLNDINISFNIENKSPTILLGENGAGKSTLIEAILHIFMPFYSLNAVIEHDKDFDFDYDIEYGYASNDVLIEKRGNNFDLYLNGEEKAKRERILAFRPIIKQYLPMRIISFYSGANNRIEKLYSLVTKNYRKAYLNNIKTYLNFNAKKTSIDTPPDYYLPKRNFIYCHDDFSPVYLCAIMGGADSYEKKYLREKCQIERINEVTVTLNTSKIKKALNKNVSVEEIQSIFDFLDNAFQWKLVNPIEYKDDLYYTIKNIDTWGIDSVTILDFFEKLQAVFDAKLDVEVVVKGKQVNCDYLSEGQRQLIKMLGMLGVCKSQDTLVLLDEPDAHMNPKWKYEIRGTIEKSLESSINTQAIIATHDPLVMNGVDKEQVRIFSLNENGFSRIIAATEDTVGLGIDGLLQSEYYGLRTSYDKKATDKFFEQQTLYIKLINNEVNEEDKNRLKELTREVGSMQMSYNSIDFLYDDFISVFRNMELYRKEYLSYEDVIERREKIQEIIRALYEGQV